MVRKPLQRVANGSSVDDAGADTAQSVPEVQAGDRLRVARADPAQRDQDRANTQHESRSDSIDQVSFKRYEPGFQSDEQRKGPLNRDQRDVQMGLYGFGEESPGILQVRDGHHRDDAGDELDPTIGNTRGVNQRSRRCSHRSTSMTAR